MSFGFDISQLQQRASAAQRFGSLPASRSIPWSSVTIDPVWRNPIQHWPPFGGGGGGGGGGTPAQPAPTPAPAGLPADLTSLLGDIPTVQDGDVITADDYNRLTAALVAIAGYLGDSAVNHQVVLTLAPTLLGSGGSDSWTLAPDHADAKGASSVGWLPLDLPDGARIQALTVVNEREQKLDTLAVKLQRLSLADPKAAAVDLATVSRPAGDGTVQTDAAQVSVPGITDPAAVDELRRVINGQYRYLVRVDATGTQGQPAATIYAFEVAYTRW